MHFDIFTLFPGMFAGVFDDSILKRAQSAGVMSVALHNIRDYAEGRHRITDDTPYGGGGGMVMKPEPIFRAVETVLAHEPGWMLSPEEGAGEQAARGAVGQAGAGAGAGAGAAEGPGAGVPNQVVSNAGTAGAGVSETAGTAGAAGRMLPAVPVILLTPQGRTFNQKVATELAAHRRIALVCGRYEGFDERVRSQLATDEISIGDFVISGGELAAMIIVDAVTRLLPGALGYDMAPLEDSFATGLLEYPQYTRPPEWRGESIPDILASGDHARVARWRREQALRRTWERRPDLLRSAPLSDADRAFLARLAAEAEQAAGGQDQGGEASGPELDTPPGIL